MAVMQDLYCSAGVLQSWIVTCLVTYLMDPPPTNHILLEEQYLLCLYLRLSELAWLPYLAWPFWNLMCCCMLLSSLARVLCLHAQLVLCTSELVSSMPTQMSASLQTWGALSLVLAVLSSSVGVLHRTETGKKSIPLIDNSVVKSNRHFWVLTLPDLLATSDHFLLKFFSPFPGHPIFLGLWSLTSL